MKYFPRTRGVTLVELLTVLTIVAILASIAIPSYRRYVIRSNRTEGTAALLRIQVAEEKYFLEKRTYTTSFGSDGLNFATGTGVGSFDTPSGFYAVTIGADPGSSNNIATSYLATATAKNGQADDTACASMTINDQGVRGSSPSAATTCWR